MDHDHYLQDFFISPDVSLGASGSKAQPNPTRASERLSTGLNERERGLRPAQRWEASCWKVPSPRRISFNDALLPERPRPFKKVACLRLSRLGMIGRVPSHSYRLRLRSKYVRYSTSNCLNLRLGAMSCGFIQPMYQSSPSRGSHLINP